MTQVKPPRRACPPFSLFLLLAITAALLVPDLHAASSSSDDALDQTILEPANYALSNSVTTALGKDEKGHGLKHVLTPRDGQTTIANYNGVPARVGTLAEGLSSMTFCFQIDPAFKQKDVGSVRIEIEYLDPQPGTMGMLYDALDGEDVSNPKYKDGDKSVRLTGSKTWQKATFRIKGDGGFNNRQTGRSDFRFWAKTPVLYVRRVTVTREQSFNGGWTKQFSTTNQVSVLLGQEKPDEDGVRYVEPENSGRTVIQIFNGAPCRLMNRANGGRMFDSLYFAISPSFKGQGLTNAVVEIEYLAKPGVSFRLQFDGIDGDMRRIYQPVLPDGARVMRFGTGADYATIPTPGVWSVATFHVTNSVFLYSQKDGADFRLEVVPPEILVRRVTVKREDAERSGKSNVLGK